MFMFMFIEGLMLMRASQVCLLYGWLLQHFSETISVIYLNQIVKV